MKSIYEQIDSAVRNFFVEGISLSGDDRSIITIDTAGMGLSIDQVREVMTLFYADHPICFFLDTRISYRYVSGSVLDFTLSCYENYKNSTTRNQQFEKIIKSLGKYVDYCKNAKTRFEYVSAVIFKMADDNVYAYDSNGVPENSEWAHSIVGIMSPDYAGGVCESYVRSFQFIMNYLGIPCITVLGETEGKNK